MIQLILLILFIPIVNAQQLFPESITVNVYVLGKDVNVVEVYKLPITEQNVESLLEELGTRYILWSNVIKEFGPYVCENPKYAVVFTEGNSVTFRYVCEDIARVKREDIIGYLAELDSFRLPVQSGVMVLGENMEINVVFPDYAKIISVTPAPEINSDRFIVWKGPINSGDRFSIRYYVYTFYKVPSITNVIYQNSLLLAALSLLILVIYRFRRDKVEEALSKIIKHFVEFKRGK